MKRSRTLELLSQMLSNVTIVRENNGGLCSLILYYTDCTPQEKDALLAILLKNRPKQVYSAAYYWRPGAVTPRKKFLSELINSIKNGTN